MLSPTLACNYMVAIFNFPVAALQAVGMSVSENNIIEIRLTGFNCILFHCIFLIALFSIEKVDTNTNEC